MRIYQRYGHQCGRDQAAQSRMGPKCGRDRASLPSAVGGSGCYILQAFALSRRSGSIASSESYCGSNSSDSAQLQPKYGFVAGFCATYACAIDAFQKNICFLRGSCHSRAAVLPHSPEVADRCSSRFLETRPSPDRGAETCLNGQAIGRFFRQAAVIRITVSK
jgi:hypothetical protein